MKIKGKAIFELTNIETGEKRVVKEENMVTNAFKYMVQAPGTTIGGPHVITRTDSSNSNYFPTMSGSNYSRNLLRRYTGGLLLFSDKLEEDPDHVYITADDPDIVGVGAELAYMGSQTCAGSYNTTESGSIENGYKYVWDFTTSQANGDIGCACLTTLANGGIGCGALPSAYSDWWGALSSECNGYVQNMGFYLPPMRDYFLHPQAWYKGYMDIGRNLFIRPKKYYSFPYYSGSTSSVYVADERDINNKVVQRKVFVDSFIYKKSIDLDIFRFPYNNFSLFDVVNPSSAYRYYDKSNTTTVYEGHMNLVDTVTVEMPSGLANLIPDDIVQASVNTSYYWPTDISFDEGFMYISFIIPTSNSSSANYGCNVVSGGKIYVWKINMNTFESSYFTITNTTGQTLAFKYNRSAMYEYYYNNVIVTNDYTVLFSDPSTMSGNMWIIDNATGSTIKKVTLSDDSAYSKPSSYTNWFVRNNILHFYQNASGTSTAYISTINLVTGVKKSGTFKDIVVTNGPEFTTRTFGTKFPLFVSYDTGNYSVWFHFYTDPQVLMTINNLEDVVTKTSAETMKVTYIITQSEDE